MIRAVRRPRRKSKFYGWTIVWTLAVTETISWGILYYAFAVFLVPMQTELGWSTPQITGAYSLALVVTMILSPPLGHWFDRSGPRVPMTLGSMLGTVLVEAWSRVESLAGFYLIWAGIGVALALTLYEPAFAAASTWFVRGRSRALLILTTVAGLASTIFLPVAGWLIERLGWRDALLVLAIVLGVTTIPAHALVLRRRPEDLGLLPDGELAAPGQPSSSPRGVALSQALHDPAYWWLNGAFFLGMAAAVAIGVYLIPNLAGARGVAGPRDLHYRSDWRGAGGRSGGDHRARPAGAGGGTGGGGLRLAGDRARDDPRHVRPGIDLGGSGVAGRGTRRGDPDARHARRRPLRPRQLRRDQRHPGGGADGRPRRGSCRGRSAHHLARWLHAHARRARGHCCCRHPGDGHVCAERTAAAARVSRAVGG